MSGMNNWIFWHLDISKISILVYDDVPKIQDTTEYHSLIKHTKEDNIDVKQCNSEVSISYYSFW